MVLHLDRLHTDPPKEARGMAGPGLATTRPGSLARVMTNSPCQRGLALLKLKGHPVGISEVPERRGFATGRDFASTGSCSPRPRNYIVSQQISLTADHCLTADQCRGSYSLPAPATRSRNSER